MADLSESEIAALRQLLQSDQRRQWLISGIKAISLWLVAIGAAWLSVKGMLAEAFFK